MGETTVEQIPLPGIGLDYPGAQLDGEGGVTSAVFNATLVVAGGVTALLAFYLLTSLERWALIEPRVTRARVLIVYVVFLVLAACFIAAAVVPITISLVVHNVFAIGMAVVFGAFLLGLRWVLPCLPGAMMVLAIAVAGGIVDRPVRHAGAAIAGLANGTRGSADP